MTGLPSMVNADGIRKYQKTDFRGYNHTRGAGDGEFFDMKNMSSDYYPLLSPRKPRYALDTVETPNGLHTHDGIYWVDGTTFYADGNAVTGMMLTDTKKQMESLGAYIVILPDKKYYNRLDGTYGNLTSTWSGSATIENGTYAEEEAEANTIRANVSWDSYFKVGDAVEISGSTDPGNNKTIIIREIEGGYLRFYENSFTSTGTANLTIQRNVPDMDFICENENRLWGCHGDEIYASKLGDPFNWNVFDGVSTDSYAVMVGSAGDFTACCSFLGYPIFFKEEHIYKVFGDRPSNFQVMSSASLGVEAGSEKSCAIAGEILFYLSRAGIVAYSGGIPQNISAQFGDVRYRNAVAGSDGVKYYVSMQDPEGVWHLFVYDTLRGMWHREDQTEAVGFGWNRELYMLAINHEAEEEDGKIYVIGNIREVPEDAEIEDQIESIAETSDFAEGNPNKKGTSKIQIRVELEAEATLKIEMMFDSDGVWRHVKTLETTVKRSFYLPIIPRRSDHYRIRFTGAGDWKMHSLVRENYSGSEL